MTATPVSILAPAPAERVRSLLLAEPSMVISVEEHRAHLIGRHRVDCAGRLLVELPVTSCLAEAVRTRPGVVSTVEVTDVAPTPMRQRVRAQLRIEGRLTVDGPGEPGELLAELRVAAVALTENGATVDIEPDRVAAAAPDPLADHEHALLCHLVEAHPAALDRLAELVEPLLLHGVRRVHALRLDRFGLVLRLEYASRDRDVRLAFAEPLADPTEAPARLLELLARPPACRRRAVRRPG